MSPTKLHLILLAPSLTALACRPVLTIGWGEIIILLLIFAVLLGPPLFRLFRRWDEFSRWRNKKH